MIPTLVPSPTLPGSQPKTAVAAERAVGSSKPGLHMPTTLTDAVHMVDVYTSPRRGTAGNFDKPSYFQAGFNGAADGLYLFGLPGIGLGAAAACIGIAAYRISDSATVGVAAGTLGGCLCGLALAAFRGGGVAQLVAGGVGGALLGGFETLRGDPRSKVRDSNSLLSAIFLRGPAKLAGAMGAMVGAKMESNAAKMVVAGLVGAAVGAGVAAAFPAGSSVLMATLLGGSTAVLGPFIGPRMSQFLRNAAEDVGKGMQSLGKKLGISHKPASGKLTRALGTIPVSFVREGARAFILSDGRWGDVVVGGIKESIRQVQVVLASKDGKKSAAAGQASEAGKPVEAGPASGAEKPAEAGRATAAE